MRLFLIAAALLILNISNAADIWEDVQYFNYDLREAKMNQEELTAATKLLEGRKNLMERMSNSSGIKLYESYLEQIKECKPTNELQNCRVFLPEVPIIYQSDASVARFGQQQIKEMQGIASEESSKGDKLLQQEIINLSQRLELYAKVRKLNRIGFAFQRKMEAKLNNTLLPIPFYLQGTASLAELPQDELEILVQLEEEKLSMCKRATPRYGEGKAAEIEEGLKRLKSAQKMEENRRNKLWRGGQ